MNVGVRVGMRGGKAGALGIAIGFQVVAGGESLLSEGLRGEGSKCKAKDW